MTNEQLISFDLKADFAFFKKPDYNDGLQLSYNMLHKPALLGILGAIIGMEGYKRKGELPEYYQKLKHLSVGIEPLQHEKGNFQKTSVRYTNGVGYANADGNLLVEETMLVKPAYRCYLLLNTVTETEAKLYDYLKKGKAEFIPYLGKNEFQAWVEPNVTEWDFHMLEKKGDFSVDSMLIKEGTIKNQVVKTILSLSSIRNKGTFSYFERLPIGFNEQLMQYQLNDFVFTDWKFRDDSVLDNLYVLKSAAGISKTIQLF